MRDPANPTVSELFRTAVHEAGHALIAYILRRPIVRAYVLPAAEVREELRGAVETVDTGREGARTELKLTLAGMIAEGVCGLEDPDNWYRHHNGRHYAHRDLIDANNISITLSPNVLRKQRILEKLSAETRDVLLANKTALLTLAKELQSRLELDRNGVYKILRTAGVKRGWRAQPRMFAAISEPIRFNISADTFPDTCPDNTPTLSRTCPAIVPERDGQDTTL
jgi:hypothetical protein